MNKWLSIPIVLCLAFAACDSKAQRSALNEQKQITQRAFEIKNGTLGDQTMRRLAAAAVDGLNVSTPPTPNLIAFRIHPGRGRYIVSAYWVGLEKYADGFEITFSDGNFRFSLKALLIATTVIAVCVYWLMPMKIEIYSDRMLPNQSGAYDVLGQQIDVLGRNKTESFVLLYENVKVLDSEPTTDPRLGRLRITISASMWQKRTLDKYEILRVRNSLHQPR